MKKLFYVLLSASIVFTFNCKRSSGGNNFIPPIFGFGTVPSVTIDQAAVQADPTGILPINFTVVFAKAIDPTTFDESDITQSGTASGITWDLSTVDNITWTLSATAVTGEGTLVPVIEAGAVTDAEGNPNTESTSADNSITYDSTVPHLTINQAAGQSDPTNTLPINFTVVSTKEIEHATFTTADITQSGTASGITWELSTTDNITWTLSATAVTGRGTLVPVIEAGKVTDTTGNPNTASTTTDNNVTYAISCLYVTNETSNDIYMYRINDDGTLQSPVTYSDPDILSPTFIALHPTKPVMYVSSKTPDGLGGNLGNIARFNIHTDGTLDNFGNVTTPPASYSTGIFVHPTLQYVYIACQNAAIQSFSMDSDGLLTFAKLNIFGSYSGHDRLLIGPLGSHLYSTTGGSDAVSDPGKIYRFNINLDTIELETSPTTPSVTLPTGFNRCITMDASGENIYAAAYSGPDNAVYRYDKDLNYLDSVDTGDANNVYVKLHPNGLWAYVGTGADGHIKKFDIIQSGVNKGALVQDSIQSADCPVAHAIAIHPSGKYLYCITWNATGQISAFTINEDGTLTNIQTTGDAGSYPTDVVIFTQ